MDLIQATASDFSACMGQEFLIRVEGREAVSTELVEVRELPAPDDDPDRRRPFSLLFRGPAEAPLRQGIFRLENETLGALEIFLVTVGPDKEGRMLHESVFT